MIATRTLEDLADQVEDRLDYYQLIFLKKLYLGDKNWKDFWIEMRYDLTVTILDANELDLDDIDRQVMEWREKERLNDQSSNEIPRTGTGPREGTAV